ncbi:ATP-binding protein [Pseudonocardia saturnea]
MVVTPCGAEPGAASAAPGPQPGVPGAAAPAAFVASVPAAAAAAWLVRERLTAWLTAVRWPALAGEDVVFAVSEAVSNCIEHAYPSGMPGAVIEISALIEHAPGTTDQPAVAGSGSDQLPGGTDAPGPGRRLRIRVRDFGRWRPAPPDPGHRGRGLQMMIALMSEVLLHYSDTGRPGTEVTMVSRIVASQPQG